MILGHDIDEKNIATPNHTANDLCESNHKSYFIG